MESGSLIPMSGLLFDDPFVDQRSGDFLGKYFAGQSSPEKEEKGEEFGDFVSAVTHVVSHAVSDKLVDTFQKVDDDETRNLKKAVADVVNDKLADVFQQASDENQRLKRETDKLMKLLESVLVTSEAEVAPDSVPVAPDSVPEATCNCLKSSNPDAPKSNCLKCSEVVVSIPNGKCQLTQTVLDFDTVMQIHDELGPEARVADILNYLTVEDSSWSVISYYESKKHCALCLTERDTIPALNPKSQLVIDIGISCGCYLFLSEEQVQLVQNFKAAKVVLADSLAKPPVKVINGDSWGCTVM